MIAFNWLLALFPLALLALFVWGRLLESQALEASAIADLRRLFPSASEQTLSGAVSHLRSSTRTVGVVGALGALWASASFWGSLDTAFCRIYPYRCRGWLAQKRLASLLVLATLALVATSVALLVLQTVVAHGAARLPFGLAQVSVFAYAISLAAGHLVLLALLVLVYWLVPNGRVPFAAVWPGAVTATVVSSVVGIAFPVYLARVSSVAQLGSSVAFAFVTVIWFYAQALALLAGAVVNSTRLRSSWSEEPVREGLHAK